MPKLGLGLSLPQTRVASAPLIPTSGLSLWLKADAGVTLSGANVTAWADQSGNGNNAVGADTLPTLQPNTINGLPSIRFNNSDPDVSRFTISNNFNLKNSSVFVVVKQLSLENSFARILGFLGSNNDYDSDDGLAFVFNNTAPQLQLESNSNSAVFENLVADGVFALVSYKIDNSGNMSVFYNGALGANAQNADMTSQNSGGSIYIAQGSQNVSGSGLYGDIAEVIIYNSNLTTPERQQVEAYLMGKYALSPLLTGLLAYWKLDTTGWIDSSGNGRHLTLQGSLSNPTGLIGNSATGFSDSNYLITPSGLAPGAGQRTYSGWVYLNSNDIGYQMIFAQGGSQDYESTMPFYIESNNKFTSLFTTALPEDNTWTNVLATEIIPNIGAWYHLVQTLDGSIGKFYVNGTLQASSEYSGSIEAPDIDRFLLGRFCFDIDYNGNEFNPLALDGKLDEVGVWNRALTGAEITSLYNGGAGKTYPFN